MCFDFLVDVFELFFSKKKNVIFKNKLTQKSQIGSILFFKSFKHLYAICIYIYVSLISHLDKF